MSLKALKKNKLNWQDKVLIGILILSFFLNFWLLYKEGYSNQYYSAAIKSMLSNAKAFFYGSFDSGSYVTVDKPPLGLWIQALSAMVFGVNSFGLILPSALAGSMSVLLVYSLVKKAWGDTAGIIGAAVIATTPILVALSRTNNLDMMLIFFLLCGVKFIFKASEKQSLKYYILAMVFIGLGFNIKMMQAYLVLPAFVLMYFLGKGKFVKKLLHTIVAVLVLAAVSFSWALYVDSVPASERPYIGSSSTNSVVNLVVGYNGLNRLTGQQGMGAGRTSTIPNTYLGLIAQENNEFSSMQNGEIPNSEFLDGQNGVVPSDMPKNDGTVQNDEAIVQNEGTITQDDGRIRQDDGQDDRGIMNGGMQNGGGAGSSSESGASGVFRLYTTQLAGLISWFLLPAIGMVVFAGICCVRLLKNRKVNALSENESEKLINIIFWCAWLVPMAVFFSIGGFIHRYYVVMLCPAIGALAAIAAILLWKSEHRKWLVPIGFVLTLAVQCFIVVRTSWLWILAPMLAFAIAGLVLYFRQGILQKISAVLMLISLFVAPLAWSLTPMLYSGNSTIPNAGPELASSGNAMNFTGNDKEASSNSVLYEYLLNNYDGERWAIAVSSSNTAAPIILNTGLPVMAIGGFSGNDSILTLDKLKEYVSSGELRYYMASDNNNSSSEIYSWVKANGAAIDLGNGTTIYDLSNAK